MVGLSRGRAHDVDDDAALARAHVRIDDAGQIDVAVDLDVPGLAPGLAVDLRERAGRDVAGIVDQDIDVRAGLAERLDLGLPEVAAVDRHLDAVLLGQPLRQSFIAASSRAARCRWQPSAAMCSAMTKPMPFEAPVIRTDLPLRLMSMAH